MNRNSKLSIILLGLMTISTAIASTSTSSCSGHQVICFAGSHNFCAASCQACEKQGGECPSKSKVTTPKQS